MTAGYIPKRRGILDHLRDGRLTLLEFGAHDTLLLLADKSTGIWTGSAKALAAHCGAGDVSERQARHLLESLEKRGYIRRFPTRRSHRNYPILIDKFQVTFGAYSGKRLNASATTDWLKPVYDSCLEDGLERGAERAPNRDVKQRSRRKAIIPPVENSAVFDGTPKTLMTFPPLSVFERVKQDFPFVTRKQFDFATERISARAKTPPRSESFWARSMANFFSPAAFGGEVESFLADEAYRLSQISRLSFADLAEELKCCAAKRDLPYNGAVVGIAVEIARERLERDRALQNALRAGGGFTPLQSEIHDLVGATA